MQLDGDDEAEESVPKTSEDSDNASEAGEVSASEQSGDEQSEHEQEAEDEDDQDGKAESEGEAEGMEDGDGDGNSSLECSFAHCKPLAASSEDFLVGSNLKKGGRVFYGNDMFYVLFRSDTFGAFFSSLFLIGSLM